MKCVLLFECTLDDCYLAVRGQRRLASLLQKISGQFIGIVPANARMAQAKSTMRARH